jgi:DNA polymerase
MQAIGVLLNGPADFAGWRDQARRLLAAEVPPEAVEWRVPGEAPGLFATGAVPNAPTVPPRPRAFVRTAHGSRKAGDCRN